MTFVETEEFVDQDMWVARINGISAPIAFKEAEGLELEMEASTTREAGKTTPHKRRGSFDQGEVTMRFGTTKAALRELVVWFKDCVAGKPGSRKSAFVDRLEYENGPVAYTWDLKKCLLRKLGDGAFNADTGEVAVSEIILVPKKKDLVVE